MSSSSNVRKWATAISTHQQNGRKIIFRYAQELDSEFVRGSQPVRIILLWRYQSETGQPYAEEHQRMILLEDTLEPVLNEQVDFATLALVSTGENSREWIYYAKSEDEFMSRLNTAIREMDRFPIEIHIAPDPNWTTYETFAAGVKGSPQ